MNKKFNFAESYNKISEEYQEALIGLEWKNKFFEGLTFAPDLAFKSSGRIIVCFENCRDFATAQQIRDFIIKSQWVSTPIHIDGKTKNYSPYELKFHPDGHRIIIHTIFGEVWVIFKNVSWDILHPEHDKGEWTPTGWQRINYFGEIQYLGGHATFFARTSEEIEIFEESIFTGSIPEKFRV